MTARKLFGTDGVRGKANQAPMTAETALKLGIAAGSMFKRGKYRNKVVIGKDTRLSGYMIEPSLVAGFTSVGMDVLLVGPIPTPAIAMLTKSMRADLGVMISASHNPYEDNGIKLFAPDGYKLSDEIEIEIEHRMFNGLNDFLVPSSKLGRAKRIDDAQGRYIEYVKSIFPDGMSLDGMKIVIDCANGAAYKVAPTVLSELGAEVVTVGVDPDGFNINRGCGATDTEFMRQEVVKHGADLGIALDGDADRVIVSDEKGNVIDGDQLLALIANSWLRRGMLRGNGVVATVMSNMGLEKYLESCGVELVRTQVGDRYVVECMKNDGYNLGGEQSGHIILGDYATTGDGLASALHVLAAIIRKDKPASEAASMFETFPQLLKNVRFEDKIKADLALDNEETKKVIGAGEEKLGKNGRVLIRKSGTEPLVRVMAEGEDEDLVKKVVDSIKEALEKQA